MQAIILNTKYSVFKSYFQINLAFRIKASLDIKKRPEMSNRLTALSHMHIFSRAYLLLYYIIPDIRASLLIGRVICFSVSYFPLPATCPLQHSAVAHLYFALRTGPQSNLKWTKIVRCLRLRSASNQIKVIYPWQVTFIYGPR